MYDHLEVLFMKAVQVNGLKYKYPDSEKLVLDDLSFEIEQGEFIGVIGRNTAGKSTLCFALAGLVPHFFKGAYGGSVIVQDINVRESDISDIVTKVGLIFENPFSQMTGAKYSVYQEIAFGLENIGIERELMMQRIEESLGLLNILHLRDENPFNLSGGQMQRVAIASVIAMKPDILILDEPTSQLDPQGSSEVFKVVENLAKEGMTIIMVEHKLDKIAEFADRVLLLDHGRKIDYDTPHKIFSRDDLMDYGIAPPVITRICKALGIKKQKIDTYPVSIKEIEHIGDQND
jgi:energy-coupling factor transporter ATP-binding protein EcfA2